MEEPRWLTRSFVDLIHQELLFEHGGSPGIRAGGEVIESALMRPLHRFAHEPDSDLEALAASYLFGLAKNHDYVDGNKRVGFAVAVTFLLLNGIQLEASEAEAYDTVIGVVEGSYSEAEVAIWIRSNSRRVGTGCPFATSSATTAAPTFPVAPVTRIMAPPYSLIQTVVCL
jgi:death-on-curing protein